MNPDDDDEPIDEVTLARASARLDDIARSHPELVGSSDADNVTAWIAVLETDEEKSIMAKETSPTTQVAFRLPDKLIERLDRHVMRMNAENPGLEFSRADAVRSLLTRALDVLEGTKRGGRS